MGQGADGFRCTAILAGLLLGAGACAAPALHARVPRADGAVSGPGPEWEAAADPERLFEGIEGLWAALKEEHARPMAGEEPEVRRRPDLERSAQARYRARGFGGPVRHVLALAATGRTPARPAQVADLIAAPEVERRLLAATRVERVAWPLDRPAHQRQVLRVRIDDLGPPGLGTDLDFHLALERWDLPDGRIVLRYDPHVPPAPRRVTLWRGACLIEPLPGGGARATEVILLGTDFHAPLVGGLLLRQAQARLTHRALNLWVRARQAAAMEPAARAR